ncbi:unnamed protein product, partial [Brenthis ino]
MLLILNQWWLRKNPVINHKEIQQQNDLPGYIVFTNYPYMYRKSFANACTFEELQDHCCLFIPNLKKQSIESLKIYNQILRTDIRAKLIETLRLIHVDFFNDNQVYNLLNILIKWFDNEILHECDAKIADQFAAMSRMKNNKTKNNENYVKYAKLKMFKFTMWQSWLEAFTKFIEYHRNSIAKYTKILARDLSLDYIVHMRTKTHVQELNVLMNVEMSHGSIKNQIQGRKSQMRRNLLSPKILEIRCQIALRFDLQADSIILPDKKAIFDKDFPICGTIDSLFTNGKKDEHGKLHTIMYDWKTTNKDLLASVGRVSYGLGPASIFENTSLSKYYIQQNIYRYMLEKESNDYNIKIDEMHLITFNIKDDVFRIYKVPYISDRKIEECVSFALQNTKLDKRV